MANISEQTSDSIAVADRQEMDEQIDAMIARHKNNRYEINRMVFESVAALTASENASDELASQGLIQRFRGSLTGRNRDLEDQIAHNQALAQYTAQQTLQKLEEQNLMSFELVTAVNNKLNASVLEIETEINEVYQTLGTLFKQARSNLVQLENRVERLERNVRLLNWQNSIEYQMYNGVEYSDLDTASKIVCLTRDFYEITEGNWTTSDLLLLKSAMSAIDLSPKEEICYRDFIAGVVGNPALLEKLYSGLNLNGVDEYSQYVAVSAGIQKRQLLEGDERYLVENTAKLLQKHGCDVPVSQITDEMFESYEADQAHFNLDSSVNCYDLLLELLYNLEQVQGIQDDQGDQDMQEDQDVQEDVQDLSDKVPKAEYLFSIYAVDRALPLLQELSDCGSIRAKYMLALLYETGCEGLERDDEQCDALLDECIAAGYIPAVVRKCIPLNRKKRYENTAAVRDVLDSVRQLAEEDDMFAAEEYARCCLNFEWLGYGRNDYVTAMEMFKRAPYVLSLYNMAEIYKRNHGVEEDEEKALQLFLRAADMGYNPAEFEVAKVYGNQSAYTSLDEEKTKAFEYFVRAEEHGSHEAITYVAMCYLDHFGTDEDFDKGISYLLKGEEKRVALAVVRLGLLYLDGYVKETEDEEEDYKIALEKLNKALLIDENCADAYGYLSLMYKRGYGVKKDGQEAERLMQKAKKLGFEEYGEDELLRYFFA